MNQSKTVLFLPFLQMPSGHHQVADSLMTGLKNQLPHLHCKKLEILSYSYGRTEALVSGIYLNWIRYFPASYNWLYRGSVYKKAALPGKFRFYELLFLTHMKKLVEEIQPDCIICTHALPSYMLSQLKTRDQLSIPVINVYTDYFIHRFWGISHIDYHFVSSLGMKNLLLQKGVKEHQIYCTGIPVHQDIQVIQDWERKQDKSLLSILVTGGSLGVGAITELIGRLSPGGKITYYVLCGKNKALFQSIKNRNNPFLIPLPYIESRKEMNDLYDMADGILTKPGGVTISECLVKHKPIFIYDALPGQEMINLEQLQTLGLIFLLDNWRRMTSPLDEVLLAFYENNSKWNNHRSSLSAYHQQLEPLGAAEIISKLI
ncbi:MGDG synthase family glycosyltransferase [Sediminibacillus massiliensis]|uniref:MGDG synthase family glycosyltransferase n=1 Tax=Sediminibacillus massiliensis TaxID=1926277 RepID=UPI0009885AA0|nr:glycosyltransferase [Sediminibacillus massiliensis]